MAKQIKQWITVNHIHIPIFEGESKADAVKRIKEGAKKGKSTRPISKEQYEKKAKRAAKAYEDLTKHHERVHYANKRIQGDKDTSDEAKKEKLNADRTLKEAQQRFEKRSAEHQEAVKHRKYTSIKVTRKEKSAEQSNQVTEQEKAFRVENNKKALNQYREWEKQKKQELKDYTNSSEYRRGHYSWDNEEAKNKVEAKKKELEDSVEKNRKEALRIVQKLQEDGALPRYSQPREDGEPGPGTILDSTVKADPRYETLSNSLRYSKHQATSMLRNIMYAEEEGKNSFSTTVYDFQGGRRYSYSTRTATYLNKPGEEGYTNFGEFLTDYKKAMRQAGWKVTATENADSHRAGYRTARGGYQSASHSSARTLTFEKIPEKAVKPKAVKDGSPVGKELVSADSLREKFKGKNSTIMLEATSPIVGLDDMVDKYTVSRDSFHGNRVTMIHQRVSKEGGHAFAPHLMANGYDKVAEQMNSMIKTHNMSFKESDYSKENKTWQDKDAEVKVKQIANADKQKATAQEAQKPRYYTNMDLEDEQFRKDALAEMRRYQRNWEFYDSKEKRNISPNGYKELEARIKEIEDYEKKLKGKNGEPKLEYDLGGNLLGKDGKLAKNMSKQELEDWQKEVETKTDRNKEKVKALRTMAEKADTRKIITGEKAFEGKQASWAPKTGDKINDVGHNEAQNKLYDAPTGTTFEMTSRDGDYVGEYTKQSDGSWKGSQKYKSGYKMPTTVYTPKGFAMNVVGKNIKVINDGSEKKADWRDVDTKPQKSKKVNLSATYTNAMNSADTDKVERAIAKLTNNGGSSEQIKDLKEKLRRLRHSEYKEDPFHYNGKGMR